MKFVKPVSGIVGLSCILLLNFSASVLAVSKSTSSQSSVTQLSSATIPQVVSLVRQGKYRNANDILSKILINNRDNAEVHYWKAIVSSRIGDIISALKHIKRSLELKPQNRQIHQEYASILVKAGKYSDAEKIYSTLLNQATQPYEVKRIKRLLRLVEGQRLINESKLDEALTLYHSLAQMYPNEVLVYEALGFIYTDLGFWEDAESNYFRAAELEPNNAMIQRRMARMYGKMGDDKARRDRYRMAIELDPVGMDGQAAIQSLLMKGKEAVHKKQIAGAIAEYHSILEVQPENLMAKLAVAEAYTFDGQLNSAKMVYLGLLEKNSKNVEIKSQLASLYFNSDQIDEAINQYQEILEITQEGSLAVDADAKLNMLYGHKAEALSSSIKSEEDRQAAHAIVEKWVRAGRLDNAQWLINGVLKQAPDDEVALYWLGLAYEQRGQLESAMEMLSKSAWVNPQRIETRMAIARVSARTGDLQKAEATYRDVISQTRDKDKKQLAEKSLGFVIGESLVRNGNTKAALTHYRKMLSKSSRDVSILKRIADVYASVGDMKSANKAFKNIKKIRDAAKRENSLVKQGRTLAQNGSYNVAQKKLKKALSLNAENVEALYLLGMISAKQSNIENALYYYQQSLKLSPENITLRTEYARLLTNGGKLAEAEVEYKEALSRSSNRIQRKSISLLLGFVKGQQLIDAGEQDLALDHFQNMRIIFPHNINVLEALASVYVDLSFLEEAGDVYENVLRLSPNRVKTYVQLAVVAEKQENPLARIGYLSTALKLDPNGPHGTLASNLLLKKGKEYLDRENYDAALEEFDALLAMKPSHVEANLLTASVYEKKDQEGKAEKIYQKVLVLNPVDLETRKKLAEFYVKSSNLEGALIEYQKIYDMAPSTELGQNASAKLNFLYGRQAEKLSKNLRNNADRRKAVETAEVWITKERLDAAQWLLSSVTEQDPKLTRANFLLSKIHKQRGELNAALDYASKSVSLEPNNPEFGLEYANLLVSSGLLPQAEKAYVKVIALSQNDIYNRSQAERQLGLMVGERLSSVKKYRAALKHYRKLQAKNTNDTELMARVAGTLIKIGNLDEAEEIYLRALEIEPNNTTINVALAQLYKQKGENSAYLKQLRQAFLLDPTGGLGKEMVAELGLNEGMQQLQKRRWNSAVMAFNRALEANPNNIFAQVGISAAYLESGETSRAKSTLDRVMNLGASNLDTRLKFLFMKASYAMDQ